MPPFGLPDLGQLLAGFALPVLPELPFDPAAIVGSAQQGSAAVGGGSAQLSSGSTTGSLVGPIGSALLPLSAVLLPMVGGASGG